MNYTLHILGFKEGYKYTVKEKHKVNKKIEQLVIGLKLVCAVQNVILLPL